MNFFGPETDLQNMSEPRELVCLGGVLAVSGVVPIHPRGRPRLPRKRVETGGVA